MFEDIPYSSILKPHEKASDGGALFWTNRHSLKNYRLPKFFSWKQR